MLAASSKDSIGEPSAPRLFTIGLRLRLGDAGSVSGRTRRDPRAEAGPAQSSEGGDNGDEDGRLVGHGGQYAFREKH